MTKGKYTAEAIVEVLSAASASSGVQTESGVQIDSPQEPQEPRALSLIPYSITTTSLIPYPIPTTSLILYSTLSKVPKESKEFKESVKGYEINRVQRLELSKTSKTSKKFYSYKKPSGLGARAFVRWLMLNDMMTLERFNQYKKIVEFVKGYSRESGVKVAISESSICKIKSRIKYTHTLEKSIPRLPEILSFFRYVEKNVPSFKGCDLLRVDKNSSKQKTRRIKFYS